MAVAAALERRSPTAEPAHRPHLPSLDSADKPTSPDHRPLHGHPRPFVAMYRMTSTVPAYAQPNSSEIPWPLAATTDENGDARPSSTLIGACEPVSEIDAGAFPAPRTVCCEHAFQHRFLGWPCRAHQHRRSGRRWQAVELIVERAAALDIGKDEVVACIRVPDPAGGD